MADDTRNREIVERASLGVWSEGNLALIDELFADDYETQSLPPMLPGNREGFKQWVGVYRAAFPDATMTLDDVIVDDTRVAVRWTTRATHQGEFMGIPASGNRVETTGITIYALRDGRITRDWTQVDLLGMMQQLGAMPEGGVSG